MCIQPNSHVIATEPNGAEYRGIIAHTNEQSGDSTYIFSTAIPVGSKMISSDAAVRAMTETELTYFLAQEVLALTNRLATLESSLTTRIDGLSRTIH